MRPPSNIEQSIVKHGTEKYPYPNRSQCRTCCSSHRKKIEKAWIEGVPPGQILSRLPEHDRPSLQSIKRHFRKRHLAADNRIVGRRAEVRAERRWKEIGHDATVFIATEVEVAQMVMEIVTARIASGELSLTTRDLMKAAWFQHEVEREDREAATLQRQAEDRACQSDRALTRLLRAVLDVAGEQIAHEAIAETRRHKEDEDILDLPSMGWALRWHREYVNSVRFDDDKLADRQPAARQAAGWPLRDEGEAGDVMQLIA